MNTSPTKVLIAGALGQDGAYLCELALRLGCTVVGGVRDVAHAGGDRAWRLRYLGIAERVSLVEMNMADADSIDAALRLHHPDTVFNLAAQSSVARSFESPLETAAANGMGAVRLFESARHSPRAIRVVQATSADIMSGALNGPVSGTSPYGAAKAFAHLMARVYRESLGTFVSSAILYNHESPLRGRAGEHSRRQAGSTAARQPGRASRLVARTRHRGGSVADRGCRASR
jgi:GDPmannose 4,6-dehydratase